MSFSRLAISLAARTTRALSTSSTQNALSHHFFALPSTVSSQAGAFPSALCSTPAAAARRCLHFSRAVQEAPKAAPAVHGSGNILRYTIIGSVLVGSAFAYTLFSSSLPAPGFLPSPSDVQAKEHDFGAIREAVATAMEAPVEYDNGSYGPLLVRLAWHASGTYDKTSNTGGSNGATMRFPPECNAGANAGLKIARDLLEPIKQRFPWISYADLWTLAGCVAIEEMGGPHIPWRAGRMDKADGTACPPDGRLPDGDKGAKHIRDIFYRMGFNDQETVALIGAHALGRCHSDRSGFSGPWTNAPTTFSNLYFKELLERTWVKKKWSGPPQFEDKQSKSLMMLPTDMALATDKHLRKYAEMYAKDEELFFADFAKAFSKLLELGVPFPSSAVAA